ncbi:MAG: FAD-linked oxidase C-terminal domain-containing protein [Planctomycetota bacterium]
MMDNERLRIQDDLRGVIQGDVLCDRLTTQMYASDASIYQLEPIGVIRPRSIADVIATVQYAAANDLATHPRGSGSGVSGESLGRGLMIDFTRFMRRIVPTADPSRVTVQGGVILADLNRTLASEDRWFGPDPATRSITSMGSVLATNASGSHYLRSGSARDTVDSMRVVTVDGELLNLSQHEPDPESTAGRLARGLTEIRRQFAEPIHAIRNVAPARTGYRLDDVVNEAGQVDLARFLVGTQGTLALIIDATVRTEAIPAHRGVLVLFFHRLDSAARSAVAAQRHGLVACDMVDRRLLQIARESETRFADLVPAQAEAMLLVEIQGESLEELNDRLDVMRRDLCRGDEGAFESVGSVNQRERDLYWSLCRRVVPRQYRVKSKSKPLPFTEDLWVPPDRMPAALVDIQNLLKQHQTTATIFAHAGHGQLHLRPQLDLGDTRDRGKLAGLSLEIAEAVWKHEGWVCCEHAAGLSRSYLMPKQYSELWQAMGQVKRLFDPMHRLNPGKYFGAILQKPDENLRPADQTIDIVSDNRTLIQANESVVQVAKSSGQSVPQLEVLQHWPGNATISEVTRNCNGCGRCRTGAMRERQCPVFRANRMEEATPRAKANLLRGVLSGQLETDYLADDQAKAIADLCFNCHQCRVDCPASVDIPKVVGELKAQYVATNGLPISEHLLNRVDTISSLASRVPWLANPLINNGAARWIAEKLFGLVAARQLPLVAKETFVRYAAKRRWTKPNPSGGLKVAYFVDHYANYHDPDIGLALAEILQQNRIGLYVPTGQVTSGMTRITSGDIRGARRIARRNVRLLADLVRQGYSIVATEPSAALCLKHEYPGLLDDEEAYLVAEHSHEACSYLLGLHQEKRLDVDFQAISSQISYHQPCHLRALNPEPAAVELLSLIPVIDVDNIDAGCTGMAGTWGLSRKNYRSSLRIGWPLISSMRQAKGTTASTECSACRMQIEHGANRRTLHPMKILAYAYGRMPKLEQEFANAGTGT